MTSTAITLRYKTQKWDLELPLDVPIKILLPRLIDALKLKQDSFRLIFRGKTLTEETTLENAGVLIGSILYLATIGDYIGPHGIIQLANGQYISLTKFGKREISIGRPGATRPDVDLSDQPEGDTVSRDHALLMAINETWSLSIQNGTNRSFVNEQIILQGQTRVLGSGDKILLGKCHLTFMSVEF